MGGRKVDVVWGWSLNFRILAFQMKKRKGKKISVERMKSFWGILEGGILGESEMEAISNLDGPAWRIANIFSSDIQGIHSM